MIAPTDKSDGGDIIHVTRQVWVYGDNWSSSFDLVDDTVNVMNPGDEDPLFNIKKLCSHNICMAEYQFQAIDWL